MMKLTCVQIPVSVVRRILHSNSSRIHVQQYVGSFRSYALATSSNDVMNFVLFCFQDTLNGRSLR